MPINVSGPDGVSVSFPDGTEAMIIHDVMAKHFGGAEAKPKASPITADALVRQAAEGIPVVGGAMNKFAAGMDALTQPVLGRGSAAGSIGERYSENIKGENAKDAKFEAEHPIASTAAQLAGGIAAPLGLLKVAPTVGAQVLGVAGRTLPAQIAQGAASGAAINAADAAVRGNDPLTAAGVGGLVGAAAPPVGRLVGAAVSPALETMRGIVNPTGEAARRVATAIERDRAVIPPGSNPRAPLTDQEFTQASASGMPVNAMDLGGELTRGVARSAANTSPEGRAVLNRAIDQRFETQSQRMTDYLNSTYHFPNAQAQQEAIENTGRITNRANYNAAMREGEGGLWSPELERLAGSDAVSGAMQKAASAAKDEGIIGGYGAMNPRFTFTPDGRLQTNRGPNGVPTYPDLRFWDLTRRQLSDAATQATMRGQATEAARLGIFAGHLNTELDRMVPSYARARAGAAHFFGAENALQAGQQFVTSKMANPQARAALAEMSPTERQLFQDGFVDSFMRQIREAPDRRSVMNSIAQSPAARERLAIALGPRRATELEAHIRIEGVMDLARGAVQGNSTTARQLAELGLAGGAGVTSSVLGGGNPLSGDPTAVLNAALVYGAIRGGRGALNSAHSAIDHRVAGEVARLLTSNNPAQIRMGMTMLGRHRGLLGNLRNADAAIARAGAVQAQPDQRMQ